MNPDLTAYIDGQEPWKQKVLRELRGIIHEADPDIQETMKWGAPTFEDQGQVVWIFCAENWVHVSFRHGSLLGDGEGLFEEAEDTESKGKRTIRFREGQDIPKTKLIQLVRQAVENNRSGKKVDFDIPKAGSREYDPPHEYEQFLKENGMLDAYLERPYYQQKGWVEWIEQAKTDETKEKRKHMMLVELKHDQYMPNKADRFTE